MVLQFLCPNGHKIHCPEERAGQPARCPKCGIKFRVPTFEELDGQQAVLGKNATNGDNAGSPGPVSKSRIGKGSTAIQNQIEFLCPNNHLLHGAASLQGRAGMCPECGAKFRIPIIQDMPSSDGVSPLSNTSMPAAPASTAGLIPPALKPPAKQPAQRQEPQASKASLQEEVELSSTEFAPPQDFELSQEESGSFDESDSVGEFESLKDLFGVETPEEPVPAKPAKPQKAAEAPAPAETAEAVEPVEPLSLPELPNATEPASPAPVADQAPASPAPEPPQETLPPQEKAEESPMPTPPVQTAPPQAPRTAELSSLSVVGIAGASAVGTIPPMTPVPPSPSQAALMDKLWALKIDSSVVELSLGDGRQIVPVRFLQAMSQGSHGVFAVAEPEGTYSLMAIAWDAISTIVVKGLKELPLS